MANKPKVKMDSAGVSELLSSAPIRAVLTPHAEAVLAAAQAGAPVASGRYRDSLHIESDTTDRAVERVVASAPHALLVESRTGNLARAMGAA